MRSGAGGAHPAGSRKRTSIDVSRYPAWSKRRGPKNIEIMWSNREVEVAPGMWVKCIVVGLSTSVIISKLMVQLVPVSGSGDMWVAEADCRPW
jgi:hypothetical protein